MKIRKGDTVKIISGKDLGKSGKVTKVLPKDNLIVVESINIHKKHTRSKKQGQKGQVIQMAMPIHVSNIILVCSSCNKTTRVARKMVGSRMARVCKKCGTDLG